MNYLRAIQASAAFLAAMSYAGAASAAELVVAVTGAQSDTGKIRCALFSAEDGFPSETASANVRSIDPSLEELVCRYEDVAPGTYAVSVVHDINDSGGLDKNFVGIPKEPWGVSNNVRPTMRAPHFDEATFELREPETRLDVGLR